MQAGCWISNPQVEFLLLFSPVSAWRLIDSCSARLAEGRRAEQSFPCPIRRPFAVNENRQALLGLNCGNYFEKLLE